MSELAVKTTHLGRIYRTKKREARDGSQIVALENVELEIPQGELFGVLGPNGAGKTTLIKILTTLLAPSSGAAWVAGHDVATSPWEVRRHINMVSGGESSGYGLLTVEENLWMFSQFYGVRHSIAKKRIAELLDVVGLADRAKTKIYHLSTGMRQKMNFARGFITDPDIIFLDEPTLGLDVQTARILRKFVREWVHERPNKTLLLTTHYMQEADELCNRVAIIDQGKILACDTPSNLKKSLRGSTVFHLEVEALPKIDGLFSDVQGIQNFSHAHVDGKLVLDFILESEGALMPILSAVERSGGHLHALEKRAPTLEDVFINLVGHGLEHSNGTTQ